MDIKLNTVKTFNVILTERELKDMTNMMQIFRDMYRGDFLINDLEVDDKEYSYLFWVKMMNVVEQMGNMTASDFCEFVSKIGE